MNLRSLRFWLAATSAVPALVVAPLAHADEIDDEVRAQFLLTTTDACFDAGDAQPDVYRVTFINVGGSPDAGKQTARIYRFLCFFGAYNAFHVFYTHTEFLGVQRIHFAIPAFDVDCEQRTPDGFDCLEATVVATGMTAVAELVNTEFDAVTSTLTSLNCWRGLCDASERGMWVFDSGRFVLKTYDVDATFDGDTTAVRIVDFAAAD